MSNFNNSMILYFPHVPVTVTLEQFEATIVSNNFGTIRNVDVVPKTHHVSGEIFNTIFVHFESWLENELTSEFQRQVRDPNFKSIVYYFTATRRFYWHVNEHVPPKTQPIADAWTYNTRSVDNSYKEKYTLALELARATEYLVEKRDAEILELYEEIAILKSKLPKEPPVIIPKSCNELGDNESDDSDCENNIQHINYESAFDDDSDYDEEDDYFKTDVQLYYEYETKYMKRLEKEEKAHERDQRMDELQLYYETYPLQDEDDISSEERDKRRQLFPLTFHEHEQSRMRVKEFEELELHSQIDEI